ncbi:MAG: hypothetical protein IT203_12940 [Fimbriimonadaceae bacterium]|nr:hypothetical protein [Fimbriimonadaceae bacterium]
MNTAAKTLLVLAGCCILGVADAMTMPELLEHLNQLGQKKPSLTCLVWESVRFVGRVTLDKPRTLSWGRHDDDRTYTCAVHEGKEYVESASGPRAQSGDTNVPNIRERILTVGDESYEDFPEQRQGTIERPGKTSLVNVLCVPVRIEGLSVSEFVGRLQSPTISEGPQKLVTVSGSVDGVDATVILDPSHQFALQSYSLAKNGQQQIQFKVKSYTEVAGYPVPDSATADFAARPDIDVAAKSHSYTISAVEPKVDEELFKPSWREGTRIGNGIDGKVYLFQNGELVLDPLTNPGAANKSASRTWIFLISTTAFLLAASSIFLRILKARKKV